MEVERKYIISTLVIFGFLKALIAILTINSYISGSMRYPINDTIIFGVLGVLLIIGALNLKHKWGKVLTSLFFTFMVIQQLSLLLASFNIQWLVILITGREIVGSKYWYIDILYISFYSLIALSLYFSKEKNA